MNADRRIVPSHHVTSVLAENDVSKRTLEVKEKLRGSNNKLHKVANKWVGYDGINPLSRVMLHNIAQVPRRPKKEHHITIDKHSGHEAHHGHDAHAHGHEAHHGHDESHHHGQMSEYCGIAFGMFGRIIGTILDYILKLLLVLLIFGPTRTAILVGLITGGINLFGNTALPVGLIIGIAFVVHLIFAGASKLAQSNGEHGGGHGGSHGHDAHGHGDSHGHDDHGHGHGGHH